MSQIPLSSLVLFQILYLDAIASVLSVEFRLLSLEIIRTICTVTIGFDRTIDKAADTCRDSVRSSIPADLSILYLSLRSFGCLN